MTGWFKELRKSRGFTQKALADRAGISQPSLANIESGKTKPRITTARRLAKVLKIDWKTFYQDANQ